MTSSDPCATLHVEWIGIRHAQAFADLFDRCHSQCFCRYWHFEGDKNAWLLRCAVSPEENRIEAESDLREGAPRASGLVAIAPDRSIVGWMKLAPRGELPKLRRLPTYRALDLGDDDGVVAIGCLLVDPGWRRRGVARRLVREAVALLTTTPWNGVPVRAIEAYPREGLHAEEAWTGPETIFEGFTHVAGEKPYPVLRRML